MTRVPTAHQRQVAFDIYDAFTTQRFAGNPAGVVLLNEALATSTMQRMDTLSSQRFAGRRVDSAGHDLARDWIADRITDLGYKVSLTSAEAQSAGAAIDCLGTGSAR